MKKQTIFFVVVMMFGFVDLNAQSVLDVRKFRLEAIDLPPAKEKLIIQPIAGFEILDARPDDFCLGFVKDVSPREEITNVPMSDFAAIAFTKRIEVEILQNIMPPKSFQSNGFSILLIIKELWLYENDVSLINNLANPIEKRNSSGLLFRADLYLNRNASYIPLFQIDSVFTNIKPLERSKFILLQNLFSNLCQKINDFPVSDYFEKAVKTKSRGLIDSFYMHSNQVTITSLPDTTHQYICNTFEDFKHGNYLNANLRRFSDKVGDYYYNKDEKGNESLIRSYAFYNKGAFYIKTNNTYSPLFVNKNRCYTIGSKFFARQPTSIPIFIPLPGAALIGDVKVDNGAKRSYQPLMIDMATGNVY